MKKCGIVGVQVTELVWDSVPWNTEVAGKEDTEKITY